MISQFLILAVLFVVVVTATMMAVRLTMRLAVRARVRQLAESGEDLTEVTRTDASLKGRLVTAAQNIAQIGEPDDGWESAPVRQSMMHAGLYQPYMPSVLYAAKIVLSLFLCLVASVFAEVVMESKTLATTIFFGVSGAAVGYLVPGYILRLLIKRRQTQIIRGLPDASDFLVVCVEAGAALDAAFVRVAQELALRNPALAQEMHWVTLEFRAGRSREQALKNFAERTGVEEVDSLANMLIQADRFGTSTADALRVYAEMMRTKRQQRAEESAAKIPVKLLIPLIFCIFPGLLVVLAGPAMVQIYRVLLPSMSGG